MTDLPNYNYSGNPFDLTDEEAEAMLDLEVELFAHGAVKEMRGRRP